MQRRPWRGYATDMYHLCQYTALLRTSEGTTVWHRVIYCSFLSCSIQNTMMSITRPTRRGLLFLGPGETVVAPRKPLLSRHYQSAELQLILPQFCVKYLTSFARQTGAQVDCQLFNFVTYQELNLIDHNDGLARRARVAWKPKMMNVHLKRAQAWLLRDANEDKESTEATARPDGQEEPPQQQRTFFLSLDSLIYIRSSSTSSKNSTHSVLIGELKAVWNLTNRRTLFLVYERYQRNNILRSNLSNPFAKELEHIQEEKNLVTLSDQLPSDESTARNLVTNDERTAMTSTSITVTNNGTTSQPSTLASFLDQLISESEHKPSVDLDPVRSFSPDRQGILTLRFFCLISRRSMLRSRWWVFVNVRVTMSMNTHCTSNWLTVKSLYVASNPVVMLFYRLHWR